jgi:hypothetical protein
MHLVHTLERRQPQIFAPTLALGIEERPFTQTDRAISQPDTASLDVVIGGGMECTPVVPEGNIATLVSLGIALPAEPYLQIVVFVDQAEEIVQDDLAFVDGYAKNALGEVTVNKHACGTLSATEYGGNIEGFYPSIR